MTNAAKLHARDDGTIVEGYEIGGTDGQDLVEVARVVEAYTDTYPELARLVMKGLNKNLRAYIQSRVRPVLLDPPASSTTRRGQQEVSDGAAVAGGPEAMAG